MSPGWPKVLWFVTESKHLSKPPRDWFPHIKDANQDTAYIEVTHTLIETLKRVHSLWGAKTSPLVWFHSLLSCEWKSMVLHDFWMRITLQPGGHFNLSLRVDAIILSCFTWRPFRLPGSNYKGKCLLDCTERKMMKARGDGWDRWNYCPSNKSILLILTLTFLLCDNVSVWFISLIAAEPMCFIFMPAVVRQRGATLFRRRSYFRRIRIHYCRLHSTQTSFWIQSTFLQLCLKNVFVIAMSQNQDEMFL